MPKLNCDFLGDFLGKLGTVWENPLPPKAFLGKVFLAGLAVLTVLVGLAVLIFLVALAILAGLAVLGQLAFLEAVLVGINFAGFSLGTLGCAPGGN